jgi:hypothetical protein
MSMKDPTGQNFTIDEVLTTIRGAFRPFDCYAESKGLGREVEIEISGGTATVFRQSVPRGLLQTDYNLRTHILGARRIIEARGSKLDPWPS